MLPAVTPACDVTVGSVSDVVRLVRRRRRVDGESPVLEGDVAAHRDVTRHEVLGCHGAHAVTQPPPHLLAGLGHVVALLVVVMVTVQVGGRHVGDGAGDGHHGRDH